MTTHSNKKRGYTSNGRVNSDNKCNHGAWERRSSYQLGYASSRQKKSDTMKYQQLTEGYDTQIACLRDHGLSQARDINSSGFIHRLSVVSFVVIVLGRASSRSRLTNFYTAWADESEAYCPV